MENPVISVIIPAYKPGGYIYENLDRLGQQTLGQEQFEVIIVLNGEREPYYQQLCAYAAQNPERQIRVTYTEGKGVSNARSVGIDEAKGQYIAFFDDDDWASPNYLEDLLSQADGNTVVVSNVKLIDDATGQQLTYYIANVYDALEGVEHFSIFQARSFMSAVWGKLIPRAVIDTHRFPDNYVLGEDALFMFIIARNITGIRLASRDTVYYVRYRMASASHRHRSYLSRVGIAFRVAGKYTSIYLASPRQYSFTFYLSRVVATLRKLFQKSYEVTPSPVNVS